MTGATLGLVRRIRQNRSAENLCLREREINDIGGPVIKSSGKHREWNKAWRRCCGSGYSRWPWDTKTSTIRSYKKINFWRDGIDELLLELFAESFEQDPEEIVLSLDVTDLPLHWVAATSNRKPPFKDCRLS